MKVDKKERKLTQLTDTHNEYRLTNNYMLWFLIDTCHFVIDSIRVMYVYEKHTGFRAFTEEMTRLRQEAKLRGDGAGDEFYKLVLNGSYGYDIMNEEKFSNSQVVTKSIVAMKVFSPYFMSARPLNENYYQVQMEKETYNCKTPLVQGFFILENAKFWYFNFIYNFMYKCLDMTRLHFVEGDIDSMCWAVAGSENENYEQQFKHVIKDHEFYNNNIYKFTPSSFYSSNNSNPTFNSEMEKMKFDKKLLELATEKQCENMLALAPKTYSCSINLDKNNKPWIDFKNIKTTATKCKGYSIKGKLNFKDYFDVFAERSSLQGTNNNMQVKKITKMRD
jgi:hypothetical protein